MNDRKITGKTEYRLIRSERKTVSAEISDSGEVTVRAPRRMSQKDIDAFVAKHSDWIEKNRERLSKSAQTRGVLSEEQKNYLKKRAKEQLPSRTAEIAEIMGVKPAGVKITSAEKRWGSCSGRNTICYSYRVMMLPQELIDFVIIHELAHIKEKNHGAGFYRIVERFEPDYREKMKKIKEISLVLPK